jgi:hypothetical protein
MLWPAARVARALWRGMEDTAVRRREPSGCSRRGVPSALRRALLNGRAFLPEGPTEFVCISYKQKWRNRPDPGARHFRAPYARGSEAARGGASVFAKKQEKTGKRLAGSPDRRFSSCVRGVWERNARSLATLILQAQNFGYREKTS